MPTNSSQIRITDWQLEFMALCKEMEKKGEEKRELEPRGQIDRHFEKCSVCDSEYIYVGSDLECEKLYEVASARFCPNCNLLTTITDECNFAPYEQDRFLSIMRQKLIAEPKYKNKVNPSAPCPGCNETTYTFYKDLGGIDYYDNYWTVCINPKCKWPGHHQEGFVWGPYAGNVVDDIRILIDQEGPEVDDQATLSKRIIQRITSNPKLLQKIKAAMQAMGEEALARAIEHPVGKIVIAGIKAFLREK